MVATVPMKDFRSAIHRMVSVSELSRGRASRIIQQVEENDEQFIVVKNNTPNAVIMSVNDYTELLTKQEQLKDLQEEVIDLKLLLLAMERMKDNPTVISGDEVIDKLGHSKEEIEALANLVEIE